MQIPQQLDTDGRRLLDLIGGESLDGSGFENERPDSDFVTDVVVTDEE